MHRRELVLLIAGASLLLAQSQPPSPREGVVAQTKQGNPTQERKVAADSQGDASSLVSAINQLTSEIKSWKDQESAQKRDGDAPSDWWIKYGPLINLISTVAVAVWAGLQWWAMHNQRIAMDRQGILMKRALKETKKAADASADSAAIAQHTLEITQGAVIDIESITLRAPATNAGQEKHNSDVLMKCCIEIVFKNFGNTTAEDFYFEMRATAGNLTPDGIVAPYAIMGRPSPIFPKRTFKQESPNLMSMFLAIAAQGAVVGGTDVAALSFADLSERT